jgi:hypothetical protein
MIAGNRTDKLAYLITVSQKHILPARMLLSTLSRKTANKIYVVGNLTGEQRKRLSEWPIIYIDEDDVDLSGRVPQPRWTQKYREWGWYKQMFLRLCSDRYVDSEQIVVLDSEVFVFDNWDEERFYTASGDAKCFFWISQVRKPDWDYKMYRGAAYLYRTLPGFENVMEYANSDGFRRHISGVVQFSSRNLAHIWKTLAEKTDLAANLDRLFNHEPDLAFCDHDFYGIAMDYNLSKDVVPTALSNELLGWYDNHDDPHFNVFRDQNPMWSMCQRYFNFPDEAAYVAYMQKTAAGLGRSLPGVTHPNQHNGTVSPLSPSYEKRLSDLEFQIRALQNARSAPPAAEWQTMTATIDAILRKLTERVLQLENDYLQMKDLLAQMQQANIAQSASSGYLSLLETQLALNAATAQKK